MHVFMGRQLSRVAWCRSFLRLASCTSSPQKPLSRNSIKQSSIYTTSQPPFTVTQHICMYILSVDNRGLLWAFYQSSPCSHETKHHQSPWSGQLSHRKLQQASQWLQLIEKMVWMRRTLIGLLATTCRHRWHMVDVFSKSSWNVHGLLAQSKWCWALPYFEYFAGTALALNRSFSIFKCPFLFI